MESRPPFAGCSLWVGRVREMKITNTHQLASYIRFQLDQLSARNAHHEFEHLCRNLARLRICSNIVPATGPVSAGGDQGRDFETFRTYINSRPIANSTFLGVVSQKPIVFACSLQKEGLSTKIRSDVDTIMKPQLPVETIYCFCTSNLPVSQKHKLQSWAKREHSVHLEILDGLAIAELLCDREVFWIAERFLDIPNDIYPRMDDEEDWYSRAFRFWKEKGKPDLNHADLHELKAAIRHATFSTERKQDLPFWIGLVEEFISNYSLQQLRRKAIYEVAVASLRGLGTMCGQENRLREYFDLIQKLEDPAELEDAAILLQYCVVATLENNVELTLEELRSWRANLLSRVEERLGVAETPSTKCPLLDIQGFLCLCIDPAQPARMPDIRDALEWWAQLINVAKDAPLFPVERFADRLTDLIRLFGECPELDKITQEVDSLLSQRYGDFIAGEKCRDRAIAFYDRGEILKAINQLHQTKIKWFAEEALRGSLLSMLLISQWYRQLGLSFAAKYYALAAAFIALHADDAELKPLLPRALLYAANCDYYQGFWCGYLELADIGLKVHGHFSKEPGNLALHDELQTTLFHTRVLMSITERIAPELLEFVGGVVEKWNIKEFLAELAFAVNEVWEQVDIPKLWSMIKEQLGGRPFGDLGPVREVTWSELGITWSVEWTNDYETTLASEQFIAVLQILLADLASVELCLPKTSVSISVCVADTADARVAPMPSNVGGKWKVTLPALSVHNKWPELEHLSVTVLSVASTILANESLLPGERFHRVLEDCFKNGISMKVFVAKPYEILYREFVSTDVFESSERSAKSIPEAHREFRIRESEELAWLNRPGPGYSKELVDEYLANRYARTMVPIRYTLKRLLKNAEFRATVQRLRDDGWLDWHILAAICSIVVNYRALKSSPARDINSYTRLFERMINELESEYDIPIPLQEFTEEALRLHQKMNMIASLKVWGLECHKSTPDFEVIAHFLRCRYNYWTDDIEHDDPFSYAESVSYGSNHT